MAPLSQASPNFNLDTRPPQGLATLTVLGLSGSAVNCAFEMVADANFGHFEIWSGTNQADVQNRTGSAIEWDDNDDPALGIATTTSTTVTGLTPGAALYFSIFAIDIYGNEATRIDAVGTTILYEEAQIAFDGVFTVQETVTSFFNAYIKVFETNPNHFFGKVRVYDTTTELLDGDFHVGLDTSLSFDGVLAVQELAENQLSGFIHIVDTTTALLDGNTSVIIDVASLFDGQIALFSDVTDSFDSILSVIALVLFDGSLDVAQEVASSFNGSLSVVATVEESFDGWLKVDYQVVFAGRIELRDPYSPYLQSATPVPNSLLIPIESTIALAIADDESGVNLDSVRLTLTVGKQKHLIYDGANGKVYPGIHVAGNKSVYTFVFNANVLDGALSFPYDEQMFVTIRAEDFGGNEFGTTYRLTTARNPILSKVQGSIIWDDNQAFKFNLEYGLNVPQRVNLVVEDDKLCLAN